MISCNRRRTGDEGDVWEEELLSFEVLHALDTYCASKGWHADISQSYLPNLYSLQWGSELQWFDVDTLGFAFVPCLVSDKLKIFGLSGTGPDLPREDSSIVRTVRHTLSSLLARCPSLEEMHLGLSGAVWNKLYQELSGNLSRLSHLRVFLSDRSSWISAPHHLNHLGQHPSLQDVSLSLNDFRDAQWLLTFEPHTLFPTLQTLKLRTTDLISCTKLLGIIGSPSLSSLQIGRESYHQLATAPQIEALLHEITHYQDTLHALDLEVYFALRRSLEEWPVPMLLGVAVPGQASRDPEIVITPVTLGPVLLLQHLSYLRLYFDAVLHLNDEFIQALAEACPHLAALLIASTKPQTPSTERPGVTLLGLLPLTEHCPGLRTLEISVNMALPSIDVVQPALAYANPAHGLQDFIPPYTHGLTRKSLGTVAEVILTMFPGLCYFKITSLSDLPSYSRELGFTLQTKVSSLIDGTT